MIQLRVFPAPADAELQEARRVLEPWNGFRHDDLIGVILVRHQTRIAELEQGMMNARNHVVSLYVCVLILLLLLVLVRIP